jgi:hypothetical protein
MTGCNISPELFHVRDGQQTAFKLGIEPQPGIEATHPDCVFDSRAVAIEAWMIIDNRDRHDIEVDIRCPGLVQPDLFLAIKLALFEIVKIQEVVSISSVAPTGWLKAAGLINDSMRLVSSGVTGELPRCITNRSNLRFPNRLRRDQCRQNNRRHDFDARTSSPCRSQMINQDL